MQAHGLLLTLLLSLTLAGGSSAAAAGDPQEKVVVTVSEGERGWLGVSITDMTAEQAKKMKSGTTSGALVTEVRKESPAQKAGIKEDDVIIQFGERPVEDVADLQKAVKKAKPGSSVKATLMRGEKKMTLNVTVGKPPKEPAVSSWYGLPRAPRALTHQFHVTTGSSFYGLDVWELNQQLGEYFGAPNARGVLVAEVEKESEGARAGFKAGDVILRVGRETVEDLRDLSEGMEEFKEGDQVSVEILRKGERKSLTITAGEGNLMLGSVGHGIRVPGMSIRREYDAQAAPGLHLRLKREYERQAGSETMQRLRRELEEAGREIRKGAQELKRSLWREVGAASV